jgi:hypothetical protein
MDLVVVIIRPDIGEIIVVDVAGQVVVDVRYKAGNVLPDIVKQLAERVWPRWR